MSDAQLYWLSDHAREEAERRGIPLDTLDAVMRAPGQVVALILIGKCINPASKLREKII